MDIGQEWLDAKRLEKHQTEMSCFLEATQAHFRTDLSNQTTLSVENVVKDRLVEPGFPEEEIVFVEQLVLGQET